MASGILTINSGSSSLKFGVYDDAARMRYSGVADGIGRDKATLTVKSDAGETLLEEDGHFTGVEEALQHALNVLEKQTGELPAAVGHRVVHGGPHLRSHQRITPELMATLEASVHFAPLHIPPSLALMRTIEERYAQVPQFACFDTSFHQTMPAMASMYALPQEYRQAGVQRYGFHGLSYESIIDALAPQVPARMVVAHLGSGCSVCAIANGRSVDTSMGLTPTGGVPMGTRTGDLDPGVLLLMMRGVPSSTEPMTLDALEDLLNHACGLRALSGGSSDMRELNKAAAAGDAQASLAMDVFCYQVAKTIGSYAAALGGIDALVFTGGIGEHSAAIRADVCGRVAFLGLYVDAQQNAAQNQRTISTENSAVQVMVVTADEDGQIARHVQALR